MTSAGLWVNIGAHKTEVLQKPWRYRHLRRRFLPQVSPSLSPNPLPPSAMSARLLSSAKVAPALAGRLSQGAPRARRRTATRALRHWWRLQPPPLRLEGDALAAVAGQGRCRHCTHL